MKETFPQNQTSEHDANKGLGDTARIQRDSDLRLVDDSLEATQRMTPVQKNLARQQAVSLHFGRLSYEAQRAGVAVEERPIYGSWPEAAILEDILSTSARSTRNE